MNRNEEDKKFLHEMAGPMTIIRHTVKKLHKSFHDTEKQISAEECKKVLAMAMDALKKLEDLHATKKMRLSEREVEDEKTQRIKSA